MKIKKFKYIQEVKAIKITKDNIYNVATWCDGDVYNTDFSTEVWGVCIDSFSFKRQQGKIGDWVVKNKDEEFLIVDDKFFRKIFKVIE